MTRRIALLLAVFGLVLLASGSFVCARVAQRGRFASAYSSYGSGPEGTRALFLLAQSMGAPVQRWAEDLARLPPQSLLVALGGCKPGMARPVSRHEREQLMRWVEHGGVLLVAGARHYLPDELGVRFAAEPECPGGPSLGVVLPEGELVPLDGGVGESQLDPELDDADARAPSEITWAVPGSSLLRGMPELPLSQAGRLLVDDEAAAREVLLAAGPGERDAGAPLGAVVAHGRGHVILLASASPFQNRALASDHGGVLFARLLQQYAPQRAIVFDEYHLGVGERRSLVRYLRQAGATPVLLQLALIALVLLVRRGARFGGLRAPLPAPAAGTASLVASLGDLFARTHDPVGAVRVLAKQALARVASHHHLAPAPARRLALALDERGRRTAAEAVRRIGRPEASLLAEAGDLAACSRALDRWVAEACAPSEPA